MNKPISTLNEPGGIFKRIGHHFDELNHRFSDLLVDSTLISEGSSDDSDKLFFGIKSCKNVTFTRSRSYFDDDLQLFPLTPVRAVDKHPLLTSDEEETSPNVQKDCSQSSRPIVKNTCNLSTVSRSPLTSCIINSQNHIINSQTPKPTEKSDSRIISSRHSRHIQCCSELESKCICLNNIPDISTPDNSVRDKENLCSSRSIIVSPDSSHVRVSLSLGTLSCKSPLGPDSTLMSKNNKTVSNTSTPLNKALTPNMIFKTPVSSNKTIKRHLSALKRYSIDKAVASARQEIQEAITSKLKKSILKAKQKDECNVILRGEGDSPANSTAQNSLFSSPALNKTNDDIVKTPLSRKEANTRTSLTGVKKLVQQNEEQTLFSSKLSLNSVGSIMKGKTLIDDDDDDLPPTQPITAILLRDVVAYVEVRCGRDYLSEGTKAELETLGARVEKNFTRKVTHCFFHGGRMSTYRKAIEWKIPLVSTLWIEACKAELQVLPLKGYTPHGLEKYRETLRLYKTKGLRRAVTDSKIRRKPWKEDELNKKSTQAAISKPLPPAPTFKETEKIVDALHCVATDLRKATNQFEEILTSPILQKQKDKVKNKDSVDSKTDQVANTSSSRRKRNKKLIFGSSSDDDNKKEPVINETSFRISEINDSEIRVSYDSDDLLVYAKKQAASGRSSAPPRLLTSRKCKKLLSTCKEPEKKNTGEMTTGTNVIVNDNTNRGTKNNKPTRTSKNQLKDAEKTNVKDIIPEKQTQTKKRKLLSPSKLIENFEQDSGECTPPVTPKCPYKTTSNKKLKTGLAVKSKAIKTLASVKVMSDCDSDDSLTRAARRESSALFVKKDKKTIAQRTTPTIVCTSLCRSDEDVVKSIVAQLGTFTVEPVVSERTTHVVTPAPRRTINLLKAIARGCWVLNVQWVYKSLEVGKWLPEERFELTEFSPAVKLARCDRQAFGPEFSLEIFSGLGPFYVCRATVPPARDLGDLLRLGGGCVVSNARAAKIVIGSTPPLSPSGRAPPVMVREKWILDCITRLKQLSMDDYITVVDS